MYVNAGSTDTVVNGTENGCGLAGSSAVWVHSLGNALLPSNSALMRALLDVCQEPVLLVDPVGGWLLDCNCAAESLVECPAGSLAGRPVDQVFDGLPRGDAPLDGSRGALRTVGGVLKPVDFEIRQAQSEAGLLWIVVARQRQDHGPTQALVYRDYLTGLADRRTFDSRLERAIERGAQHADYLFAVLFIDLDHFKQINDAHGHLVGDALLVSVAERFLGAVRPHDLVARRDGDEFTILLDDLERPADAARIAERIGQRLAAVHELGELALTLTASIGIAVAEPNESAANLLRRADAAMYQAKAVCGG